MAIFFLTSATSGARFIIQNLSLPQINFSGQYFMASSPQYLFHLQRHPHLPKRSPCWLHHQIGGSWGSSIWWSLLHILQPHVIRRSHHEFTTFRVMPNNGICSHSTGKRGISYISLSLLTKRFSRIWCFHVLEVSSIRSQTIRELCKKGWPVIRLNSKGVNNHESF